MGRPQSSSTNHQLRVGAACAVVEELVELVAEGAALAEPPAQQETLVPAAVAEEVASDRGAVPADRGSGLVAARKPPMAETGRALPADA